MMITLKTTVLFFFAAVFVTAQTRDLVTEGKRELEVTNYSKALKLLNLAIEDDPSPEAYSYRAQAKHHLKDYEGAINDFSTSLKMKGDNAEAYFKRGCAFHKLEKYKEAIDDYTQAIKLKTPYYEALINRAEAQNRIAHYEEALADYNQVIALNPGYILRYLDRGNVLLSLKKYQEAIQDFDKYIATYPSETEGYIRRIAARIGLQDEKGAEEDRLKVQQITKRVITYLESGIGLYNTKKYKEAILELDKAIQIAPEDGMAYYYRGWARAMQKQHAAAMPDFNKCVELNRNGEAYYSRAWVKHAVGDLRAAITDYSKAVELKPSYKDAYYNRGICRMVLNEYAGAEADFLSVIEQDEEWSNSYYQLAKLKERQGDQAAACDWFKEAAERGNKQAEQEVKLNCVK